MTRVSLTRIWRFSASHHYWRPDWTAERNREIFGEQADSHGHDYRVEVVVAGVPDPETGWVVSLPDLDARVDELVGRLDGADLNEVIPEVSDGAMSPSTEAMAVWLWARLRESVPGDAALRAVRVWESDDLGAEVTADDH